MEHAMRLSQPASNMRRAAQCDRVQEDGRTSRDGSRLSKAGKAVSDEPSQDVRELKAFSKRLKGKRSLSR